MSNPFKAIGKVFKKVVKVVKKVALPALMIGAVVLTAGAALGALPAIGTLLGAGGLGLAPALASTLGSAISMGAMGAVAGGLAGVATGSGFMKGATTGFLGGALTGGLMGVAGMTAPFVSAGGSAAGAVAQNAVTTGLANPGAVGGMTSIAGSLPQVAPINLLGGAGTAVGSAVAPVAGAVAPVAGASGGLLGTLGPQLLQMGGQVLSGFSAGKAKEAEMEAEMRGERDDYDRMAFNYGYRNIYAPGEDGEDGEGNVPTDQQPWFQYDQPSFGSFSRTQQAQSLLQTAPSPFITAQQYQPQPPTGYRMVGNRIVPVAA